MPHLKRSATFEQLLLENFLSLPSRIGIFSILVVLGMLDFLLEVDLAPVLHSVEECGVLGPSALIKVCNLDFVPRRLFLGDCLHRVVGF